MKTQPKKTPPEPKLIGVAAVVFRGPDLLLIRNKKRNGSIELPCGKVNPDETPLNAVIRELREETGLAALTVSFFEVKEMGHYQVHLFSISVAGDALPVPGDDAEAAWFGPPELILEGNHPEDYERVLRVAARYQGGSPL